MPKRAPTPPPADDSRFFTVINPYPEQPYLAREDSKTFARWMACVVGQEHLLAFYHKPKSPNVVIIETAKTGPDFGRLMGEHRWHEFLRKPCESEAREVSQIFPCTLTTPRAMEKNGWICCDIPSSWFKKWSPESDSLLTYPYPQPRRCAPPSEDVTRFPLCRPIPYNIPESLDPPRTSPPGPNSHNATPYTTTSDDEDGATASTSDFSDHPITPPPGLTDPKLRFIPAIHGSDIPKASEIILNASSSKPLSTPSSDADAEDDDDDDDDDGADRDKNLCSAHGIMCVSGICKECAARKREARYAERARQREEERNRRARGRGPKRGWGPASQTAHQPEHAPSAAQGRVADMPPHLRSWSAIVKGTSDAAAPSSRLREDIRAEMAGRKQHCTKSTASTTTRAMPAHLRKGGSPVSKSSGLSSASSASASVSALTLVSTSSAGSPSETSVSPPPSTYDPSDDAQSVASVPGPSAGTPATDAAKCAPEPESSQRGPWGTSVDWRAYAGIRDEDARSVTTSASGDVFGNPWKHVPSLRPEPELAPRWAGAVAETAVRSAWDDDSSEEEPEPF